MGGIIVQMGDAHYQHLGDALSYKWGTHCRTNGGCVSHPRRAHNLVQIIVCYNYHSAELRVSGLPKMALWYICTFGHRHICTFGLWHICISSFSLLSYKWGTTIINIWGDAAIDALSRPCCAHYRTDGGPIVVQMGDDAIDALSHPSCAHYRTNGG